MDDDFLGVLGALCGGMVLLAPPLPFLVNCVGAGVLVMLAVYAFRRHFGSGR